MKDSKLINAVEGELEIIYNNRAEPTQEEVEKISHLTAALYYVKQEDPPNYREATWHLHVGGFKKLAIACNAKDTSQLRKRRFLERVESIKRFFAMVVAR